MKLAIFAACAPGLEPLLAKEVDAIAGNANVIPGGVETGGDRETLARLLVGLGLASHVLVRIASFPVRELAALEAHVARLPWSGWLRRDAPRRVRATAARSKLYHTGAIEERVARAITTRLGDAPPDADPDACVPIAVRVVDDRCQISLDASGPPLHRRGYRIHPHRAPLREDVARALVVASGWDPLRPLVDPMCGSGTIAIEAALIATGRLPGATRSFAFEQTALDDGETLARVRAEAIVHRAPAPILARDRDSRAIEAARLNAARAGVEDAIRFEVGPLSTTRDTLAEMGLADSAVAIVTNPPWGERLSDETALRPLYEAIGSLHRALPASTVAFTAHDRRLAHSSGVRVDSAFLTDTGGLKVAAMIGRSRGAFSKSE